MKLSPELTLFSVFFRKKGPFYCSPFSNAGFLQSSSKCSCRNVNVECIS